MSFIIEINGKDITSIEALRENFDIGILLNYKDNFDEWLFGWDYYDEAAQVRELSPELSDNDWLEQIVNILAVPLTTVENAIQHHLQKIAQAAEEEERKRQEEEKRREEFIMPVDKAILIFERGIVCAGRVKQGKIKIGDIVNICDKTEKTLISAKIVEIDRYGKICEFANTGDIIGICLPGTDDIFLVFAGKEGKEFILKK